MKFVALIIVILSLVAVWTFVDSDYQTAVNSEAEYCNMVMLYRLSGGEHGWPDYEQAFDVWCL